WVDITMAILRGNFGLLFKIAMMASFLVLRKQTVI
ncbi:hypothetical protein, partial [uncultured Gammaproteobacteria bacterium]